jgi:hypothetical protein
MSNEEVIKKIDELAKKLDAIPIRKKRVITKPPSEKQIAHREKFKKMVQESKRLREESKQESKQESIKPVVKKSRKKKSEDIL